MKWILVFLMFVSCRTYYYFPVTTSWKSDAIQLLRTKKPMQYDTIESRVGIKGLNYWVIQDKNTVVILTDTNDWKGYWQILRTNKYYKP